jgi:hypothetical protein
MFFYQSEKAEAHKEIKKLQSQRTLLERDLRKRDSATVDKRHELNSMPHELSGAFEHMQVCVILCKPHIFLGTTGLLFAAVWCTYWGLGLALLSVVGPFSYIAIDV